MKVAIIGFGTAGEARLGAYRGISTASVVAVADPSPVRRDRALTLGPDLLVRPSLTDLLEYTAIDAADICSPPAYHAELAAAALRAGCHVLCEKPVTLTASSALSLLDCAVESRRLLYPAHNYAFSPMMRVLSGAVADDGIGSPMTATFQIQRPTHARGVDAWAPDWRRDPALAGGGILLDHGTHCIYLATRLFGSLPVSVSCTAQWAGGDERSRIDEAVDVRLEFPAGTCRIDLSWTSATRSNLYQLSGPAGSAAIRDGEAMLDGPAGLRTQTLTSPTGSSTHEEWFVDMFAHFTAIVEHPELWEGPRQEILSTARIISAAYRSARAHGEPVPVAAAAAA